MELTGSKVGFLGETNQAGLLENITIGSQGHDTRKIPDSEAVKINDYMKIHGIDRSVLMRGETRIVNGTSAQPGQTVTSNDIPAFSSFLGVPLVNAGKTFGMIGLADKEPGYDHDDREAVESLSVAIMEVISRKRLEAALRTSEASLKKAQYIARIGNWHWDLQKNRLVCSDELFRICGFEPQEFVPIYERVIELIHPDERDLFQHEVDQVLATGKFLSSDHRIVLPDGTTRFIRIDGESVTSEDGMIIQMFGIAQDITERKKTQEQLLITDRLSSIGELASGITHELNNPLTSVIGFSQLLMEKDIPDDIREDIKIINSEAQRTARIVKGLLTFSRKHAPARQPVNINSVINSVLELRAYEQKMNNILIDSRLDPDLPEIPADFFQLQQVFLNIIINAEYFMIEAHNRGCLTIITGIVEDAARIIISDDGPGISKEILGHLFDPFFTTKDIGKGTGLGLSICHGIISEHGGRIYAESEPGKGATFVVELPTDDLLQLQHE